MGKGHWLGEFELCVMLAVAHLADDAYGVSVRRHLEAETGRAASIGAIYTTLGRLEEKGLVRFRLTPPQPVAGGRARKIFRLTPEGHRLLTHSTTVLGRLIVGWKTSGPRR
jgi:DNA-binding PadR family transcriptional regulator